MSDTPKAARPNDPDSMVFTRPPPFYDVWQESEGIPIHKVFHVPDLRTVPLARWERFGCDGAFVNLADSFLTTSMVLEIPPGGSSKQVQHLFETWVYVVEGEGQTDVRQPGFPARHVPWKKGTLFGPPLNTRYTHINLDKTMPARLLMVTNAPMVMSLFHDEDFIFGNNHAFTKRYKGEENFFSGESEYIGSRITRTNLIPDTHEAQLYDWAWRGKGATSAFFSMSGHTIAAHISSFPVGTYKKAHRHGPGAHVVLLSGQGYSLVWKDGEERQRVDWKEGTMFAPPEWAYHQHFNTGAEPARYLAMRRGGSPEHPLRIGIYGGSENDKGLTQFGQTQIEFEDEPPEIYAEYERELKKHGVEIRQARPNYRSSR